MAVNHMARKKQYIASELWILAWGASVQHASLYKNGAWKNSREEINAFKNKVVKYLSDEIIPQYKERIDESRHCDNIQSLIDYANEVDTGVLGKNGYKYGVAQKLLNLVLKYYWCLDETEEPPHCPVDKIVIDKTNFRGRVNWTQILTKEEYLEIIASVKELADEENCSIAHWELNNYERR